MTFVEGDECGIIGDGVWIACRDDGGASAPRSGDATEWNEEPTVAIVHIAVAKKTAVAMRCDVEMPCILLNMRFIVLIVFIFDSNSNAYHET